MAPTKIGRFEIISELGKHPLGMLYKANDPKRGHVALLAVESATLTAISRPQVQQLFSRARTATLLNSPNIASVYGGGEAEGFVHLAMEFVDGVTLRTAMARDGRMSTNELIDIARQLCNALDHAQSKGVVHQNLHPGNVKVEWDGAVKLMDMGLDIPGKHAAGDVALQYSVRYASPEQIRSEALTSRSNLYTLGAMLYELASGKKAISAEDDEKVKQQVLAGDVEPARTACSVVPKIVSDAIAKAMAKNPSDRFDSAAALLRELESYRAVKKESAPAVAPANKPAPRPASKPSYGGPDTSAVFRAMNDNFKRGGAGSNASPATQDRPFASSTFEQISQTVERFAPSHTPVMPPPVPQRPAKMSSASVFAAVHEDGAKAPLKETVYEGPIPGEVAEPEKESKPAVSPIKVVKGSLNLLKAAALEKAKELEQAATAKPAPKAVAPPKPNAKPPAKAKIAIPDPRKLLLVAAGMILAVGLLWGVSQFHSNAAEPKPAGAVTTEPPAVQPVAETAVPEPVSNDSNTTAQSIDQQRRRTPTKKVELAMAAPVVTTGEVVVNSIPEGAQISIDGRTDPQWVTPHTIFGLSLGEHTVTLAKPGYTTVIKTVEIAANQRPVVTTSMQQVSAVLSVASEPAGASVVLDGRDTGKLTPVQLSVGPGSHQVTFRKDGYFEFATSASAQGSQTVSVTAKLIQAGQTDRIQSVNKFGKLFGGGNKADMARLRVKTNPKGAYIVINGKPAPEPSPNEFFLNPGTYEVKMQLTGHPDIKRTVQLEKGKRVELDEVFSPR